MFSQIYVITLGKWNTGFKMAFIWSHVYARRRDTVPVQQRTLRKSNVVASTLPAEQTRTYAR